MKELLMAAEMEKRWAAKMDVERAVVTAARTAALKGTQSVMKRAGRRATY